jgi:hypothetical protein
VNINALMKALILARARQREQMLPEPDGVVLPTVPEFEGFTHIIGLRIVSVEGARPGLIIPLEIT